MVEKKALTILARRQARERLALERAEQAERDKISEAELVEYLLMGQQLAATEAEYSTAVAAARDRRDNIVAQLRKSQAECVRGMLERGETVTRIAARTGLSEREVRALMTTNRKAPKNPVDLSGNTAIGQPCPAS